MRGGVLTGVVALLAVVGRGLADGDDAGSAEAPALFPMETLTDANFHDTFQAVGKPGAPRLAILMIGAPNCRFCRKIEEEMQIALAKVKGDFPVALYYLDGPNSPRASSRVGGRSLPVVEMLKPRGEIAHVDGPAIEKTADDVALILVEALKPTVTIMRNPAEYHTFIEQIPEGGHALIAFYGDEMSPHFKRFGEQLQWMTIRKSDGQKRALLGVVINAEEWDERVEGEEYMTSCLKLYRPGAEPLIFVGEHENPGDIMKFVLLNTVKDIVPLSTVSHALFKDRGLPIVWMILPGSSTRDGPSARLVERVAPLAESLRGKVVFAEFHGSEFPKVLSRFKVTTHQLPVIVLDIEKTPGSGVKEHFILQEEKPWGYPPKGISDQHLLKRILDDRRVEELTLDRITAWITPLLAGNVIEPEAVSVPEAVPVPEDVPVPEAVPVPDEECEL